MLPHAHLGELAEGIADVGSALEALLPTNVTVQLQRLVPGLLQGFVQPLQNGLDTVGRSAGREELHLCVCTFVSSYL